MNITLTLPPFCKQLNREDLIKFCGRTGLCKNPLDVRGSRRAKEAALIFLEVDTKQERLSFLNTKLVFSGTQEKEESQGKNETLLCVMCLELITF